MRAYGTTYSETLFGSSMSGAVNLIGQPKATGMFVGSYTNYPLIFGTNNAERVRIDTAGNVGIGTTTPGAQLHIYGAGTSIRALALTASATTGYAEAQFLGGRDYRIGSAGSAVGDIPNSFYIYDNNATAHRLLINSSGNVGIGTTTPGYKLTVNSSNATDNLFQVATTTNQGIMVINNAGNVGIGTASPGKLLHLYKSDIEPLLLIESPLTTSYTQMGFQGTGRRYQMGVGNASEVALGLANKFLFMIQMRLLLGLL